MQAQRRLFSFTRIFVILTFVVAYLFSIYCGMAEAERRSAALVFAPEGADYPVVNVTCSPKSAQN